MKRTRVATGVYRTGPASYQFVYSHTGKQVWRGGYRTLDEARKARTKAIHDADRGLTAVPTTVTVKALAGEWVQGLPRRYRASTARSYEARYRVWVEPVLGRKRVADVTVSDVMRVLTTCPKGSANNLRTSLHSLFGDAVAYGVIAVNPVDGVPKGWVKADRRGSKVFTREQLGDYLALAPPILRFTALTGARIGEVLWMRWDDVEDEVWKVRLGSDKESTKTPTGVRPVPLSADALACLPPRGAGRVWDRSYGYWYRQHGKVCEALGIEGVTVHGLRATFATRLVKAGVDPLVVAALLGHKSVVTTLDIYVRGETVQAATDAVRAFTSDLDIARVPRTR